MSTFRCPFVCRIAALATAAWLVACGSGGGAEAGAPAQAALLEVPQSPAPPDRGALLHGGWAAYPRLVRLAHQADPRWNGRIVASLTETTGGRWQAGFHLSTDDGASFTRLAALRDPAFDHGLCCGTLYELPQAVGALPAGTLLYAASVGQHQPGALMDNRIFHSPDGGATFTRLADAACGRSAVPRAGDGPGTGVWEPEFLLAADGSLACIYSDETEPGRSQVLKLTATRDGVHWSAPQVIVAGADPADRPGMAGVRRLPDGRYLMVLEACSLAGLDCSVRLLQSADGLQWGAPGALGQRAQTAAGQFFRHAPTLAWARTAADPAGRLVLIGQIVAGAQGAVEAAHNGRAVFVNERPDGSGPWQLRPAPIGLPGAPVLSNWCQNYSTPLLPSADGQQLLLMQTDLGADGRCTARFGRGRLD